MAMTFAEVTHSKTLLMLPVFPLTVYLTQRGGNTGLVCKKNDLDEGRLQVRIKFS